MKKIAVLVHSLTVEYTLSVLGGITEYCKDKDISLIIGQVRSPHSDSGIFDYQYWSCASYLFSKEIDAIVIVSGSFSSADDIKNELNKFLKKPIFSIGLDYQMEDSYYIHAECNSTYDDVVLHLKEKHGCRKFAFMTASLVNSKESEERFMAFKNALEKHELIFDEDRIFHAAFTSQSAITALKEKINSKDDIDFDAILAANDLMALGCISFLQEIGLKIPQDVIVFGFDETSHASTSVPKLSTMDQLISKQGALAVEAAYNFLENKVLNKEMTVSTKAIFRQSCGCVPLAKMDNIYIDYEGKLCRKDNNNYFDTELLNSDFNMISTINGLYTLFDMLTSATTLFHFSFKIPYILNIAKIDSILISFYDKPIHLAKKEDFVLPEKLNVAIYAEYQKDVLIFEPNESYNPHEKLYPEKYFTNNQGSFFVQPIFSGETNYGYIICKTKSLNYALYSLIFVILGNALAQSWEYTSTIKSYDKLEMQNQLLQNNNTTLSKQSQTDELTGVLNRRGFMNLGQQIIDIAIQRELKGMVLFADMDGLKKINDTYGHDIGDKAIKAISSVFPKALRADDIFGRLSGDEFAVVAVGLKPSALERIRIKINELCQQEKEKNGFEFNLSVSIGYTTFDKKSTSLSELLIQADKQLYTEKKAKRAH